VADTGFEVRLEVVAKAGASARKVAARVASSALRQPGDSTRQVISQPGWESAAALERCLSAWEARVRVLSAQAQQVGDNLGFTTRNYAEAEAKALAIIAQVRAQLDGPVA